MIARQTSTAEPRSGVGAGADAGDETAVRRVTVAAGRLPAAAWAVAIGGVTWAIYANATVGFDTMFSLAAAQDAWASRESGYLTADAPTPHPLLLAAALVAAPLGTTGAPILLLAASFLIFGALVFAVFSLGRAALSWPVGLLAAVAVWVSPQIDFLAYRAYADIPFAALVLWATLLEVRRPRRGYPILAILACAGLLRPEAWLVAAVYWIYMWPAWPAARWPSRGAAAVLVLIAPGLWILTDWLLTGDPLFSSHVTARNAVEQSLANSLPQVPGAVARASASLVGIPVAIGAIVGVLFLWFHRRGSLVAPVAVAALNLAAFVSMGAAEQTILTRFLLPGACIVAVLWAAGAIGWASRGVECARGWKVAGVVVIVLSVAYLPVLGYRWLDWRKVNEAKGASLGELESVTDEATVRRTVEACAILLTPDFSPTPYLRYWLDLPASRVSSPLPSKLSPEGAVITGTVSAGGRPAPRPVPRTVGLLAAARYSSVAGAGPWTLHAGPSCATRGQGAAAKGP